MLEVITDLTLTELFNFYNQYNHKTRRYRWEHMDPVRITQIMVYIAENAETVTTINRVFDWLESHGNV